MIPALPVPAFDAEGGSEIEVVEVGIGEFPQQNVIALLRRPSARTANGRATAEPATAVMKSRRRIACPRARANATAQLQQGFPAGGTGVAHHFAQQHLSRSKCRNRSLASFSTLWSHVRCYPQSDPIATFRAVAKCQKRRFR